jgi:hypothetical protein
MGTKITTTIDLSGPFFTKDIRRTMRSNIEDLVAAIAEEAETDVSAQLAAGEAGRALISAGVQPARLSSHVIGRVRSIGGKDWHRTAVVSINNTGFTKKQGTALMAAASVVEGKTHAFRRTTARLRKSRAVNQAELLKGLI